jgi:ribose 5-phosphate isomerase B
VHVSDQLSAPTIPTLPGTVAVGSDHAGFALKQALVEHLAGRGIAIVDVGAHSTDRVDYPDYGAEVGRAVVSGRAEVGVAVCGSGLGICMAANKVRGVRAATVHDVTSARLSRQHNDANVICLGERLTGIEVAKDALDAWLEATFEGGRHADRVAKLDALASSDPVG